MPRIYIGLDTATKLGYAAWNPLKQQALVKVFKGEPIEQVVSILSATQELFGVDEDIDVVFVMERIHHFQNANTTRSLLERYGYIKYTLKSTGFPVVEASPGPVRNFLGVVGKDGVYDLFLPKFTGERLTKDHTDALAVAIYQAGLDDFDFSLDELEIKEIGDE